MLDLQSLLHPVSPDAPGGSNLEYSVEFADFERALAGKPERQMGETTIPAEDPDWRVVIEKATSLLKSSKDLRVSTQLTRALLKVEAFHGLAQGLSLIRHLVETFWPVLHPPLDEGDHDPTSRVNAMATLTHRDMLHAVRNAPLVQSKAFGAVTLRDVEAASGRPRDGSAASPNSIDPTFQLLPLAELSEAARAVEGCDAEVKGLEAAWTKNVETGGPDFTELRRVLAQANQFMKGRVDQRRASEEAASPATDGAAVSGQAGPAAAIRGELRSREDVVRALEGICAYYARNEPSSPVPLLLERCKRLVTMSFLEIVKDMVPDGLSTIQTIAGKQGE